MSTGPPTALPWWMGAAIVLVWLAVIAAIVAITIRRRRRRTGDLKAPSQDGTPERGLPDGTLAPRELGAKNAVEENA